MHTEKRNFDLAAARWDEHPARVKLAQDIAQAVSTQIALTAEMDVMDFGCGTGLMTLLLQPRVRSITGVDTSQGMLDVLRQKIDQLKLSNVRALLDEDKAEGLQGSYDVVVSSMALHHIADLEPVFRQFYDVTNPGGYLGIADLDSEGGRFHGDNAGVFHFGFDRTTLGEVFAAAGFEQVRAGDAAEVVKPNAQGEMERFTVFLMIGRKPAGQAYIAR